MKLRSQTKTLASCTARLVDTEDALVALYEGTMPDRPIEAYIAEPRLREVAARALQQSRWRAMGLA